MLYQQTMSFVYLVKFREVITSKHLPGVLNSCLPLAMALNLSKRNALEGLSQKTLAIIRAYKFCHYHQSLMTIWRYIPATFVTSSKVLMTPYDTNPYFKE